MLLDWSKKQKDLKTTTNNKSKDFNKNPVILKNNSNIKNKKFNKNMN